MPAILVRNIPEKTHKALKERAKVHGTSTEAEVRAILEEAVATKEEENVGFGTMIQEIFRKRGVSLPEITRDKTPLDPAVFD
jgi:plasmid stability protein